MNAGQFQSMRWYLQRRGEQGGPYDEATIIGWISSGMIDGVIRAETANPASAWIPLASHAAFATALGLGVAAKPIPKKASSTGPVAVLATLLIVIGLIAGAFYFGLRSIVGERALSIGLASVVKSPVELRNEIVSVPARASTGRPLEIPYDGDLQLEVKVVKGKHVNVYVVDSSDWDEFIRAKSAIFGGKFHHYSQFYAAKTNHTRLSGSLKAGRYFIVLDNPTFGILVDAAFDVEVKAELRP